MSSQMARKQLQAMQDVFSAVGGSGASIVEAIDSLEVQTDNADLLLKLQELLVSQGAMNVALASLLAAVQAKSPILKASVATKSEILSAAIPANTPVRLFAANPNRIGFTVYNNSTNSLYGGPVNSPAGSKVFFQLATNAGPTALVSFMGPTVWTGELWVIRNSGTGGVVGYELET